MQLIVSHERNYLAVGCTNGVYVGLRANSCESSEFLAGSVTNLLMRSVPKGLGIHQPNFDGRHSKVQQVPCPL
jgi:hypothetical protein